MAESKREPPDAQTLMQQVLDRLDRMEHGVSPPKEPLLMRNLYWLDTNSVEIGLILYTATEASVFLNGADALTHSAMFRAISVISDSPLFWGVILLGLSFGSACAFVSRYGKARIAAAFGSSLYFGVTAGLPLAFNAGILGWVPHMLACLGASWVLLRGPSRAI